MRRFFLPPQTPVDGQLLLTGAEAPCGISGESDPEYLVILMPMMIQEETYYSEDNA